LLCRERETMDPRRIIEAALFISPRPLSISELADLAKTTPETVDTILSELEKEFSEGRGIVLERIGNAVRFYVPDDVFPFVKHLSPVPEFSEREVRVIAYIASKGTVLRSELRKMFGSASDKAIEKLRALGAISVRKKGKTLEIKKTSVFDRYFVAP